MKGDNFMHDLILTDQNVIPIRDALVAGIEVAGAARSTATHYHSRADQINAVKESVNKLYGMGKELPLLVAMQKGATGFFVQEALLNELKASALGGRCTVINPFDWDEGENLSSLAIRECIENLSDNAGITYILRMFAQYPDRKINNSRARKLALRYILSHPNLEFVSIKYREKIRRILTHCYGQRMTSVLLDIAEKSLKGETLTTKEKNIENDLLIKHGVVGTEKLEKILMFIYDRPIRDYEGVPLLNEYNLAKSDITMGVHIPEEVLIGLLSNPNHPQHANHWTTVEQKIKTFEEIRNFNLVETANQAIRKTKQEKEKGIKREKEVDVKDVDDPITLLKTMYETDYNFDLSVQVMDIAAKNKIDLPYEDILILVDNSKSMTGHWQESKNTPRAVAEYLEQVLLHSVEEEHALVVPFGKYLEDEDAGIFTSTDVATAFIRGLEGTGGNEFMPDAVFVLSDGYENDYEGLFDEVVEVHNQIEGVQLPVFHISPIGSAEVNARARRMGKNIASITASKDSLGMSLGAICLEADTKRWLQMQVERLADGHK
jgi:hypothetical protein